VRDQTPANDSYHSLLDFKIKGIVIFRKARNYRVRHRNGRFFFRIIFPNRPDRGPFFPLLRDICAAAFGNYGAVEGRPRSIHY